MKRILTGAIIAVIVALAFLLRELNIYLFDICVGVLALFSALEVAKMLIRAKKGNLVLPVLIFTSVAYLFLLLGINFGLGLWKLIIGLVLLLVVLFIVVFAYMYFAKDRTQIRMELDGKQEKLSEYALHSSISTVFNCIYPSLFMLLFILASHIDSFSADLGNLSNFAGANVGLVILLFALVTSAFSDVFAYFVGTLIGGKKLCPSISENKTIAGAIGAIFGSILGSIVLYIIVCTNGFIANGLSSLNVTMFGFIVLGIFASIFTQLGDLFESVLKRKAKLKDSGKVLPGHGGLMDRADGVTFNIVFVFVVFLCLLI